MEASKTKVAFVCVLIILENTLDPSNNPMRYILKLPSFYHRGFCFDISPDYIMYRWWGQICRLSTCKFSYDLALWGHSANKRWIHECLQATNSKFFIFSSLFLEVTKMWRMWAIDRTNQNQTRTWRRCSMK